MELARGGRSRFTFDPGNDIYPVWSPDGSRILFGSDRRRRVQLCIRSADGVGAEEPVLKSSADMAPWSWSPDGRFVVYRTVRRRLALANLGVLPLVGERTPHAFGDRGSRGSGSTVAGRPMAGLHLQRIRTLEVYVQSFPAPGGGQVADLERRGRAAEMAA